MVHASQYINQTTATREKGAVMSRCLDSILLWQLDTEIWPIMFNWTPHSWTLKVNIVNSHQKLTWFRYTKICTWMLRVNRNKCLQVLGDIINAVLLILKTSEFPSSSIWLLWIWEKEKTLKFKGIFGSILRKKFSAL